MHNDDFKFRLPPESIDSQNFTPETLAPETLAFKVEFDCDINS